MKISRIILGTTGLLTLPLVTNAANKAAAKPNVIIILADDLGYGDVSCYGAQRVQTPNIDQLAANGLLFTRGYATSATSTASRFALLTGYYPWRNKNAQVLPGDAPLIINPSKNTLPKIFKQAGYSTAAVGKWHLGMGTGNVNWNKTVKPAAREVGFDYSFLMAATNDRVPCVYVENGKVYHLDPNDPIEVNYTTNFDHQPTGRDNPELLKMKPSHTHDGTIINGIPRLGYMKGGKAAIWKDEEMADVFLQKATSFITNHQHSPFFLYYALHEPHVPRVPNQRFVGKTPMGPRGDAIVEADWCVGQLMKTIEKLGLSKNTLVIFTSDNGPVLNDGYQDKAVELLGDHKPAGPLRGGKYSLFEGGTRVPFITCWKGVVKPGVSNAMICQLDFAASMAKMINAKTDTDTDSRNFLKAMLGKSTQGRTELITEGVMNYAYHYNNWILIAPSKGDSIWTNTNSDTGRSRFYKLFNLSSDIGQLKDVYHENPELAGKMKAGMTKIMDVR